MEVANLSVVVSADTRDFDKGIGNVSAGVDNLGKSIADNMKSAGASITGVGLTLTGIGAPFAGFAGVAIKSFSDSQKAVAQLNAVLTSTKGAAGVTEQSAIDLAGSLQKVTTYSDETILSTESMLLTFTNLGKDIFPDVTAAALDLSTAMGTDTKSSAIQLGKALNDPIKGITALTRVGVTFTEAQKKQIEALQNSGDLLGAQRVILQEVQKEFGGSAVAAGDTFAGSLEILKNRADDVMETLGGAMIPTVSKLTDVIGLGITAFENLSPEIKGVIANVVLAGASLAVVGPVIAAIGLGISALAPVVGIFAGALALLVSPLGLAVAGLLALGAIAATVIDFKPIADAIQTGLIDALNDLKDLTGFDGVAVAQSVVDTLTDAFASVFGGGGSAPTAASGGRTMVSADQVVAMAGLPSGDDPQIAMAGNKVAYKMLRAVKSGFQGAISDSASDAYSQGQGLAMTPEQIAAMAGFPAADDPSIVTVGVNLATSVKDSITSGFGGLDFSNIGDVVEPHFNDILNAIVSVAGIVFGGPVGMAIGAASLVSTAIETDFLGIGTFLKTSGISDSVNTAFTDLKADIDNIISSVFGGGGGAQQIGDGQHSFLTDIVPQGNDATGPLNVFISDLKLGFDALKNIAGDVWDKLKPGFDALGNGITGFVGAFADTDTDGLLRVVTGIAGAVGAIIAPLVELGATVAGDLLTNLGTALPQIGGFISNLISTISNVGSGDFATSASNLGQAVTDIVNAALQLVGIQIEVPDFTQAIQGWQTGLDGIKQIVETIGAQIKTGLDNFLGGLKNFAIDAIQTALKFQREGANFLISIGLDVGNQTALVQSIDAKIKELDAGRYTAPATLPGAANGASVVQTGAVLAHKGERILNPQETAAYNGGGSGSSIGSIVINQINADEFINDLRRRNIDLYAMAEAMK